MKRGLLFSLVLWTIVAGGVLPVQRLHEGDAPLMSLTFSMVSPDQAYAQEVQIGTYDSQGTNPDGSRYQGTAFIKKVGDKYKITWTIGRDVFYGSGHLVGDVLSIDWRRADGKEGGVVIYKVMDDGTLVGTWADGKATDVLSPR